MSDCEKNVSDCEKFESTIGPILESGGAIPDDLAVHLDVCSACRDLFDRTKIPIRREDFEVLPAHGRLRLLRAMGVARVARPWKVAAGAMAAMVLLALTVLFVTQRAYPPAADQVSVALVEDHIRYLDHPDRRGNGSAEEYRAYLQSYLDFPVMIPSIMGSRLIGARRCFLLGRRAALAFYESPSGPISYFAFAADDLTLPPGRCTGESGFACSAVHGYQVVSWREAGLIQAVVGPSRSPLLEMAKACRSQDSG